MNINLQVSFPRIHCRANPLTTIKLSQMPSQDPISFFKSNWLAFSCEDFVILDYQITIYLKYIRKLINNYITDPVKYNQQLKENMELLIKLVKKLDFYRIAHHIHNIFLKPDGLFALYKYAENLQLIKLLTQLQKQNWTNNIEFDKCQKIEDYGIYSNALNQVIERFGVNFLTKIETAMCQQLALTNFFWDNQTFKLDFDRSFRQNFQEFIKNKGQSLKKKDIGIVRFSMLIQYQLQSKKQLCNFLIILKNYLLNKRSNNFSQHVHLWNKVFQISLKIYSRDNNARQKQWLEIDQILSNPHEDQQFCQFIKSNEAISDKSVTLSSMNFFLKNQPKSVKNDLKQIMLKKIAFLMCDSTLIWLNAQDIIEYIQSQLSDQEAIPLQQKLASQIKNLIKNKINISRSLYDIEYGYSYVLQYFAKSQTKFNYIINEEILKCINTQLQTKFIQRNKLRIMHQTIHNFLDFSFAESNQIQNYLALHENETQLLLQIFKQLKSYNCYFSPIIIKILTDLVLNKSLSQQGEQVFWDYLSTSLLTASITDELELDLILDQYQKIQDKISDYTLAILNKYAMIQLAERQQLEKFFMIKNKYPQDYVNSYLAVKAYKQSFLGNNILVSGVVLGKFIPFDQLMNIMTQFFTPLTNVKCWKPHQPLFVSFDNLTQQFPIQALKFVYLKLKSTIQVDFSWALQITQSQFWTNYWSDDRSKFIQVLTKQSSMNLENFDKLHQVRKMEIVFNMMNSVFDKLNQSSQKNIKQIKEIYKMGIDYAQSVYNQIVPIIGKDLAQHFCHKTNEYQRRRRDPCYDGFDQKSYIMNSKIGSSNDKFAFVQSKLLDKYSILSLFNIFNNIGEVIKSKNYFKNSFNLNRMKQIMSKTKTISSSSNYSDYEVNYEGFCKIIQAFMIIERSWPCFFQIKIENKQNLNFVNDDYTQDYLYKQLQSALTDLTEFLNTYPNVYESNPYVNKFCKYMQQGLSRIFIPKLIQYSMKQISSMNENQTAQFNEFIGREFSLYHKILTLADKLFPDEQQHFIIMMQVVEQSLVRQKIAENHMKLYILNKIELFLRCIFQGIRVRSYHLFRLINRYTEISVERIPFFNKIILHYVKYLFEKYIPSYEHSKQVISKTIYKEGVEIQSQQLKKGEDLKKFQPNYNPIKGACTLSMFINLFLRLNYKSLQQGIESIFAQESSKYLFLDYMISLTKKISQLTDQRLLSKRQRDIMSIDVYGNLQIVFRKTKKASFLPKFVQLTKSMFMVQFDMKNANIIPLQLLTETALLHRNLIALQEFQEQQKALSLAILSYHQKISSGIKSNLHLCNISYLQSDSTFNCVKTFELNSGLVLSQVGKAEYRSIIKSLEKNKINILPNPQKDLTIAINKQVISCIENLLQKFNKQYCLAKDLKSQQSQIKKLYNYFKILIITCLNNPQIIPQFYKYRFKESKLTFLDLMVDSLRFCFIMFIEFYILIVKTNSHFCKIEGKKAYPSNMLYQIEIKNRLLKQIQNCIEKPNQNKLTEYFAQALGFVLMHTSGYRFRGYRFMKNNNEDHQAILQKFQKDYQNKLYNLLINKLNKKSSSNKGLYQWLFLARIVFSKVINPNNMQNLKFLLHKDLSEELQIKCKKQNDSNSIIKQEDQEDEKDNCFNINQSQEFQNQENVLMNSSKYHVNLQREQQQKSNKKHSIHIPINQCQNQQIKDLMNINIKSSQTIYLMDKNTIKQDLEKVKSYKGMYMQSQLLSVFDLQLLPNLAPDFQPNGSLRSMQTFKNLNNSYKSSNCLETFNQRINKAFSTYLVQCLDKIEKKDLLMSIAQNYYDQQEQLDQYIDSQNQMNTNHRIVSVNLESGNNIGSYSGDINQLIASNQGDQIIESGDCIVENNDQIIESGDCIIEDSEDNISSGDHIRESYQKLESAKILQNKAEKNSSQNSFMIKKQYKEQKNCDGIVEDFGTQEALEQKKQDQIKVENDGIVENQSEQEYQVKRQSRKKKRQFSIIEHNSNIDGSVQIIEQKNISSSNSSHRSQQSNQNNSVTKTHSLVEDRPSVEIQPQAYNKQNIMKLIQEYSLNPQVIRIIKARIPRIGTLQLQAIQLQTDGQLKQVVRAELKSRGIFNFNSFDDEEQYQSKENIYAEQAIANMICQHSIINKKKYMQTINSIPSLTQQTMRFILYELFQCKQQLQKLDKNSSKKSSLKSRNQVYSSVLSRFVIKKQNLILLINQCMNLLTVSNEQFFQINQEQHCSASLKSIKNTIINTIFVMIIQFKLGLPLLFRTHWNYKLNCIDEYPMKSNIININQKSLFQMKEIHKQRQTIMEIILRNLLNNSGTCQFINALQQYIQISKSQNTKHKIFYQQIQQSLCFNDSFLEEISLKLRKKFQSFKNQSYLKKFFQVLIYLDSNAFELFFSIQIKKIKLFLQNFLSKELGILNYFKSNYISANGQRKQFDSKMKLLENYWQLRGQKKMDKFQDQALYSPKIVMDLAFLILPEFKQNQLKYHHGAFIEQTKKKINTLAIQLQFKMGQQYQKAKNQLQQVRQQFQCWQRGQLSQITKTQIAPVIQQYANELKQQFQLGKILMQNVNEIFGSQDQQVLLVAYNFSLVCYKLSLAFESICKEQNMNYHSMALLKTKPSLHSYHSFRSSHRSSGRKSIKLSLIQHQQQFKIQKYNKSIAKMNPFYGKLLVNCEDLLQIHSSYSDTNSKLLLIQRKNQNQEDKNQKIIQCTRQNVWFDTVRQIDKQFVKGNVKIKFKGQIGIDYGGISRQWVTLIAKELFNPNLGLFQLSQSKRSIQPSPNSHLVPNHLMHFEKLGMLAGKAMQQNWLLQISFTRSFLKHLLGKTLYLEDLQDIDPDTSKGLIWILNNQVDEDLGFNFAVQKKQLSGKRWVELIPNGTNIFVNQQNKKDYVKKVALFKMTQNIRDQTKAFMKGLERIIPYSTIKLLTHQQLGMYLGGVKQINIQQMKSTAKYDGCSQLDQNIKWFWNILQSWDQSTKANFLFFLTGSYKVPYGGFKQYPISIVKVNGCTDFLPVAHTCFSIVDLPNYTSQQMLRKQIQKAIEQGKGFSVS